MESLTPAIMLQSIEQVGTTILVAAAFVVTMEVALYFVLKKWLRYRYALPMMLLATTAVGLLILVVYPLIYNIAIAFSNMSLTRFSPERGMEYGLEHAWSNIRTVFTRPVLQSQHFFPVFGRTVLWTAIQVTAHVSIGLWIAMMLNRQMRFRGLYRAILLLPWAIPQVVAVLAWRGEFNFTYGYINNVLVTLGIERISWMSSNFWNFVAFNIVNIWLGVPFMSMVLLGALQSVDPTFYESAEIDGANWGQRFRSVTLPMIRPIMTPAVILGVIWTFNNFNVPYFINAQSLETSDILVTALFRAAFEYNRYGFAAMFSIVIFFILLAFTIVYMRLTEFRPSVKQDNAMPHTAGE